jgi:polyisoprenyl-phosphate glycosyltransferase
MHSLVIPVYKNEGSIPELVRVLGDLHTSLGDELEVVFVVDGSPDHSHMLLGRLLPEAAFHSKLLLLSRNFGSFAAIRAGLQAATGPAFAVMAADLQEPPELVLAMFAALAKEPVDLVLGVRASREDPLLSRLSSDAFWYLYRKLVQRDMPVRGFDMFACTREVRDQILRLPERNSSLVGLLLWVGFRRKEISYERRARAVGRSAWTFRKKLRYMLDSVFAFTDRPVSLMLGIGGVGVCLAGLYLIILTAAYLSGHIQQPGFATLAGLITIFGMANLVATGIVGAYAWRAFENSKARPLFIVMSETQFSGKPSS